MFYALKSGDRFFCDGSNGYQYPCGWQLSERCYGIGLIEDIEKATLLCTNFSRIYPKAPHPIEIVELSDEQLEAITFMKLRGN